MLPIIKKFQDHALWGDFAKRLASLLNLPAPNTKDLNFQCLKKILSTLKFL
jgi:hypothetical protein